MKTAIKSAQACVNSFFLILITSLILPVSASESPLGAASEYNVLVFQDFHGREARAEGRIAAGGSVDLDDFDVGEKLANDNHNAAIFARGDIRFNRGRVKFGNIRSGWGRTDISQQVREGLTPGRSVIESAEASPLNFANAESELKDISQQLAQLETNGQTNQRWANLSLKGDCSSDLQVFSVSAQQLKNSRAINTRCIPADATVVINVSGTQPQFSKTRQSALRDKAEQIIYNFYEASELHLNNIDIEGSVLAPHAHIKDGHGSIRGQLFARSCKSKLHFHHKPFAGHFPWHLPHHGEGQEGGGHHYPIPDPDPGVNHAPDCSQAYASPSKLWPPNHKFSSVRIKRIIDLDGDELDVQVQCIFQDEPLNSYGDGNTQYDGGGIGTHKAKLRKERQGYGNGRVYHIEFKASDPQGESCEGSVQVGVPSHKKYRAIDDGHRYQSVPSPYHCDGVSENHAPVISSNPLLETQAETLYAYQLEASDEDGDSLTYQLSTAPQGMSITAHGLIQWQSTAGDVGPHDVAILVEDGNEGSDTQMYTLLVIAPPNLPPEILSSPVTNAQVGEAYAYPVDANDPEDDDLGFSLLSGPDGMSIDAVSGLLVWTPTAEQEGEHTIILAVSDSVNPTVEQVFSLNVSPKPNTAPIAYSAQLSINEDEAVLITLTANDEDSSDLSYVLLTLPQNGSLVGSGSQYTYSPNANVNGLDGFSFRVNDGELDSNSANITININPLNDAPTVAPIADITLNEGAAFNLVIEAEDIEDDLLFYSLLPATNAGVSLDVSGQLYWQTGYADAGSYTVAVEVTDGTEAVSLQFALNVNNTNRKPEIDSSPVISGEENSPYLYQIDASDPDGSTLTYRLENPPEGMTVDSASGLLSWLPDFNSAGSYPVLIIISDGELEIEHAYDLLIANVNRAPEISSSPIALANEGENYLYDVESRDEDGDLVNYTLLSGLNAGFFIDESNGDITLQNVTQHLEGLRVQNHYCRAEPTASESFNYRLKWEWSFGNQGGVFGPVVVVQLTDDNSDGEINTADTPDLVAQVKNTTEGTSGHLIALDGATGTVIWTNDRPAVTGTGSPAAADIDADGIVEIITVSEDRQLMMAFEHDGTLKWETALPGSPFAGPRDALAIADLDHDGSPEIVQGRRIFNSSGELIAEGAHEYGGETTYGILSLLADIDLQGNMEIVAGRVAYDSQGETLWRNTSLPTEGYNALGNFDADDYPEIVFVGSGQVYLLEHNGEIKWGPVAIPGGGFGGPPTVGDMDGDGEAEIGVAGGRNYILLETDGSIKWRAATIDESSNRTGSAVFDFEGDGKTEIIYADEQNLFVYDGATGSEIVRIPNESGTTLELPVVVDIDKDGHAELIVGSNDHNLNILTEFGIRVFEGFDDNWAPTRAIWNQHSYHITNINDDGTVPENEEHSWLSHNSYRLNTFADRSALDLPDLALFNLRYEDTLEEIHLELHNRGLAPSPSTVLVRFYSGEPGGENTLLGEVEVNSVNADSHRQIVLPNISPESLPELVFARVSSESTECDVENNLQSAAVVKVRVQDEGALTDIQTYFYSTVNVNEAPILDVAASSTTFTDEAYFLAMSLQDPDLGDKHHFSFVSTQPEGLEINEHTGELSAKAQALSPGEYNLTLQVVDLSGETAQVQHSLLVEEPFIPNTPPEILSTPTTWVPLGGTYTYNVFAFDIDGDLLTYSLAQFPQGMEINSDGQLTWQVGVEGAYEVSIIVSDGIADIAHDFVLRVYQSQKTLSVETLEDQPLTLLLQGLNDTEGRFVITRAPEYGQFTGIAPNINYIPSQHFYGQDSLAYEYRMAEGLISFTLLIDVLPVNDLPWFNSEPESIPLISGQTGAVQLQAEDIETELLQWSLPGAMTNFSINASGLLNVDSAGLAPGEYSVLVRVEDEDTGSAEQTLSFNVLDASVENFSITSDAPVIKSTLYDLDYLVEATESHTVNEYFLEDGPESAEMINGILSWSGEPEFLLEVDKRIETCLNYDGLISGSAGSSLLKVESFYVPEELPPIYGTVPSSITDTTNIDNQITLGVMARDLVAEKWPLGETGTYTTEAPWWTGTLTRVVTKSSEGDILGFGAGSCNYIPISCSSLGQRALAFHNDTWASRGSHRVCERTDNFGVITGQQNNSWERCAVNNWGEYSVQENVGQPSRWQSDLALIEASVSEERFIDFSIKNRGLVSSSRYQLRISQKVGDDFVLLEVSEQATIDAGYQEEYRYEHAATLSGDIRIEVQELLGGDECISNNSQVDLVRFVVGAESLEGFYHRQTFWVATLNENLRMVGDYIKQVYQNTRYTYSPSILGGVGVYTYSVESENMPGLSVNDEGKILWEVGDTEPGQYSFTFTVSDEAESNIVRVYTVEVLQTADNTAPEVISSPPKFAVVGQEYIYQIDAVDAEDHNFIFRNGSGTPIPDGLISWTPTREQYNEILFKNSIGLFGVEENISGAYTGFSIEIVDEEGLVGFHSWTVNLLLDENEEVLKPSIDSEPPVSTWANEDYLYSVLVNDATGTELEYTLNQAPEGMEIDAAGNLSWLPQENDAGSHRVTLVVTNQLGGQSSQTWYLAVLSTVTTPELISSPLIQAEAEKAYRYSLEFNVPLSALFEFQLLAAPAGMSISESGLLSWLPSLADTGEHYVSVSAVFDNRINYHQNYTLSVTQAGQPAIISSPSTHAYVNNTWSYELALENIVLADSSVELNAPPEMQLNGDTLTWTPTENDIGFHGVSLTLTDSANQQVSQSFNLEVKSNLAPVYQRDEFDFYVLSGESISVNAAAVDPEGTEVVHQFSGAVPAGMLINPLSGEVTWTAPLNFIGQQDVVVAAVDQNNFAAIQLLSIHVEENLPPVLGTVSGQTAVVGLPYSYSLPVSDPNGRTLLFNIVDADGLDLSINTSGDISLLPQSGDVGSHPVSVSAFDGVHGINITYNLEVSDTLPPIELSLSASSIEIAPGETVTLSALAQGGVSELSFNASLNGNNITLNNETEFTYLADALGKYTVEVIVSDSEQSTTRSLDFFVIDESDTDPPLVSIESPTESSEVTSLIDIVGSVNDDLLAEYHLYLQAKDGSVSQLLASGTDNVSSASLASLDPSLLLNGLYDVILTAYDLGGNEQSDSVSIRIEGDLKVGPFSFTVVDMEIAAEGIPVTVSRSYDSRRKNQLQDFGYGWSLDLSNVKLEESRTPGLGWQTVQQGLIDFCTVSAGAAPLVTVTLPNGDQEVFEVSASPQCNPGSPWLDVELQFNPVGDTQSTLQALDLSSGRLINGNIGDPGDPNFIVDPNRYQLTTRAGYIYTIDQFTGIEQIDTPNGHTLRYTNNGIIHSGGKSILFERDVHSRIKALVDPKGNRIEYRYDEAGDLVFVKDQVSINAGVDGTQYTYYGGFCSVQGFASANCHYLEDIIDPLGRTLLKNIYDEDGRLIAQEDGEGKRKNFDHNLTENSSVITDRDGRSTIFNYDDEGNVENEIQVITDGSYDEDIVTTYSYDANGNELTKTLGSAEHIWTSEFNAQNDMLYTIDPENKRVDYLAYNALGQETQIQDEMGRLTAMDYDARGNLLAIAMPTLVDPDTGESINLSASNIINGLGQVESTTDLRGHTTTYSYYPQGHAWAGQKQTESSAESGTTTYTYDANNNVLTETRERSVGEEVLSETVTYRYDALDRVNQTTFPDGSYSETEYDLVGNVDRERDRHGVWTDFDYDPYGRLIETRYADGSSESRSYTAEGLLESVTDSLQRTTRYEYDDAGRQSKTVFHDESFTETRYTLQGWVQFEWDAKRNLTEYEYDLAGKRTAVIRHYEDGEGTPQTQRHSFDYYDNGELRSETDANNHTTNYLINAYDQRIETQYENGTRTQQRYDAMGAKVRGIDQSLVATDYRYDNVGRLAEVQPDVIIDSQRIPVTAYSYDEAGNKLSQTDARGNTTRWTYDYFGRVLTRQLPELMSESYIYLDGMGCTEEERADCANAADPRTTTHTDFNGDITTTAYDIMGRVASMHYSKDNNTEHYSYNNNGQLESVSDQHGSTQYFYDALYRLETELRPDNTQLDYSYDDVGNRLSVSVTRNLVVSSSTAYSYDQLNRLESVIDANGTSQYRYDAVGNLDTIIYPNGLVTDYDYNSINQLTDVYSRDGDSVLSHYHYSLTPTGRREMISELTGRNTLYAYDELYRLTSENIVDASNGDYEASYEYDWVGNRNYETVNGVQTAYSYDANDRLTQSGGTTYAYDNNGNTLTETLDGNVKTYSWDGKNKLVSTTAQENTTAYNYNHNGIRTSKTENGVTNVYIVDENRDYAQVLEEVVDDNTTVAYTYGHDLINQTRGVATSYYHYDGLGSTRALSDASGSLTDSYDYEAFGEVLNQGGETVNNYLFTGEQFDASLDQYYLRARYYDQGIGRFTQMDTWQGNDFDPVTLHKYLYANADPANGIDPSGNQTMVGSLNSISLIGTLSNITRFASTAMRVYRAVSILDAPAAGMRRDDGEVTPAHIELARVAARTCVINANDQCDPGIPTIIFGSDMLEATNHYWDAQMFMGSPEVLNRGAGYGHSWYKTLSHTDCLGRGNAQQCDEYPFNSTVQGGPENYISGTVSLRLINGIHNGAAGNLLNSLYSSCGIKAGSAEDSAFAAIPVPSGTSNVFCD